MACNFGQERGRATAGLSPFCRPCFHAARRLVGRVDLSEGFHSIVDAEPLELVGSRSPVTMTAAERKILLVPMLSRMASSAASMISGEMKLVSPTSTKFGIKQPLRRAIRHSGWFSDLSNAIRGYVRGHNDDRKPFVWTKPADAILAIFPLFACITGLRVSPPQAITSMLALSRRLPRATGHRQSGGRPIARPSAVPAALFRMAR